MSSRRPVPAIPPTLDGLLGRECLEAVSDDLDGAAQRAVGGLPSSDPGARPST